MLEEKYSNYVIFLASHGDSLQILEASFKGIDSGKQRTLKSMNNAEIRRLDFKI